MVWSALPDSTGSHFAPCRKFGTGAATTCCERSDCKRSARHFSPRMEGLHNEPTRRTATLGEVLRDYVEMGVEAEPCFASTRAVTASQAPMTSITRLSTVHAKAQTIAGTTVTLASS